MNKLWICRSTEENIKRCEEYQFFKANDRYCLVITDGTPEKMAEIDNDAAKFLTMQDWMWIRTVGEKIRAEAEYEALQAEQKKFLERFESELRKMKEGSENAGDPDGGSGE